jgi:serine protease SohB
LEFLTEYGLFLAKAVTVVVSIALIIGFITSAGKSHKASEKGHIEITKLNDTLSDMSDTLKNAILDEETLKAEHRQKQKQEKAEAKQNKAAAKSKSKKPDDEEESEKQSEDVKKRVFVLDFDGDIHAHAVDQMRHEITAALSQATANDEIILRLESGGGAVHSYGLAASQLDRIRKQGVPLTICVDKVAASGGYMMACVADKILSAPFARVGSIGVIGQLPNFSKLLKKHDVEYEQHTAGEFKRSLTMFGENTDADREKFKEDLQDIHDHFKDYVGSRREQLDMDAVATGEVWLGSKAQQLGLVDDIMTSDEYLVQQAEDADVYEVVFTHKKTIQEKLGFSMEASLDRVISRWLSRTIGGKFFS